MTHDDKNLLLLSIIRQGKNTIITVDTDDRSFLAELIKNVNYLLSNKLENKPAFLCKKAGGTLQLIMSKKGTSFLDVLKLTYSLYYNKELKYQKLHPAIDVLLHIIDKYKMTNNSEISLLVHDKKSLSVLLNHAYNEFIIKINSKEYLKSQRQFYQNANRVFLRSKKYVDNLFEHYSKLLVIRIDLSYQTNKKHLITKNSLTEHREKLYKAINQHPLFKQCVGYMIKLEYGRHKGFHYHTLFFFNGQKVFKDIIIGKMIGEYWVDIITEGYGLYFNCNYQKERYRELGIGMINRKDQYLKAGLIKTIHYLCKVDKNIKIVIPGLKRTFWRGAIKAH